MIMKWQWRNEICEENEENEDDNEIIIMNNEQWNNEAIMKCEVMA